MKAVKIEAYMQTAHFRIPTWVKREITYPLPPFSTVIGMVHKMCSWDCYHPMKISVAGSGVHNGQDGSILSTRWKGGQYAKTLSEEFTKRWSVIVKGSDGYIGWVSKPESEEFIEDLTLRLHIMPENQSELEHIYNSLENPATYISLGQHSDLMRIDKISIVDISDEQTINILDLDMYAPSADIEEINAMQYKLHKNYTIVRSRRQFVDIPSLYLSKTTEVLCCTDENGHPVFLV